MVNTRSNAVRLLTIVLALLSMQAASGQATDRGSFLDKTESEPRAPSHGDTALEKLADAIANGKPSGFAFYWGEWLSTEIEEQSQDVIQGQRRSTAHAWSGFNPSGSDYWEAEATAEGSFRIVEREEVVSRADLSELAGEQLWRVESAFVSALSPHGVRLVDPGLAVRRQSSRQPGQSDRRRLETDALLTDTSHLLEVLGRRDASSESGWEFRVRVTDLVAGHRLVDFTSHAVPAPKTQRDYVATDGGFEPGQPEPPGPEDFGRELARQLAVRLLEVI